ncbi:MAG: HEAT repeat domain-containing protein [Actinomycetota bacterium]|nr:MAG: hypothetical protein FD171_976 [Actinomycetota bacterium]MDO8949212.1 HEAT repeat domain-containing protein [Actinomycetota bacterium]MDP3629606.1 HEAT repeat domain-containing protein [Actinomycetota bacterium]
MTEKKPTTDDFAAMVRRIRSAKTDPGVRTALVYSLGASGDPRAIPILRGLIAEDRAPVLAANLALARFGRDEEVERALLERFRVVLQRWGVGQPGTYFTITHALGRCGGAATAAVFVDTLPMVFASCDATHALLGALEEIGPAARESLEQLRDRGRPQEFVRWAEELLALLDEPA